MLFFPMRCYLLVVVSLAFSCSISRSGRGQRHVRCGGGIIR